VYLLDGQTFAIAGLTPTREIVDVQKIPARRRPDSRLLFNSKSASKDQTELS